MLRAYRTGGLVSKGITQKCHCRELLSPYFSTCVFTLSSTFLGSTCHPAPTARHRAPGNCPTRDVVITNTNSCILPLTLQAGEQTPSLLSRGLLEQKVRSGTLRQRNTWAGYQENFFFHTKLSGGSFGAPRVARRAQESSSCGVGNQSVQGRGMRRVKKKMCLKRSWAGTNSLLSSKIKPREQLKASAVT